MARSESANNSIKSESEPPPKVESLNAAETSELRNKLKVACSHSELIQSIALSTVLTSGNSAKRREHLQRAAAAPDGRALSRHLRVVGDRRHQAVAG